MAMSSHPPFEHNPHVYAGINPEGNPTSELVVHSPVSQAEPVEDDVPVDANGDGQLDGYEVFSKDDLIAECKQRGLPIYGTKADLIGRLQEADQAAQVPEQQGGEPE